MCPNTLDALFTLGGEESPNPLKPAPTPGDDGGLCGSGLDAAVEEVRRPKPKRFPGLGGSGGGRSSAELVLPVFCLVPGRDSPLKALCSYFCRMKRSSAPSTSSTSIGMFGFTLFGLYIRLEATFPTRFMLSTWSLLQLSMLNDLTFDICVPSLRCSVAHRMQRKMPKLQLAHPGFRAPQSAHLSLPATDLIRSWSARSLRACWRLFRAEAILDGGLG